METQKIINLLNDCSNEESKFATKKWYVIVSQTAKDIYNQNSSIKFETESVKISLCYYSDEFILVKGDILVAANNDTHVGFKKFAPFFTYKAEIDYIFIYQANRIDVAIPTYNLIEYSDNYADK